jgi:hypothetical protein
MRPHRSAQTAEVAELKAQEPEALTALKVHCAALFIIDFNLHLEEGDLFRGSPEEYVAAGSSYIAYSGRFFVDEAKRSLSHEMAVSFFPNWVGQRQVRLVEVDGERLQLEHRRAPAFQRHIEDRHDFLAQGQAQLLGPQSRAAEYGKNRKDIIGPHRPMWQWSAPGSLGPVGPPAFSPKASM